MKPFTLFSYTAIRIPEFSLLFTLLQGFLDALTFNYVEMLTTIAASVIAELLIEAIHRLINRSIKSKSYEDRYDCELDLICLTYNPVISEKQQLVSKIETRWY